jgi:hypothetical protein
MGRKGVPEAHKIGLEKEPPGERTIHFPADPGDIIPDSAAVEVTESV